MNGHTNQPNVDDACAPCVHLRQVVEIGDWVPREFQSEDEEALSKSEEPQEVVPSPPRGGKYGEQKTPNAEPERTEEGRNENIGGGHGEVLYVEHVCVFARQDLDVV